MKGKLIALLVLALAVLPWACTVDGTNAGARHYGGATKVELERGQKLVNVTWKADSLWILTRPMRDGETAERYTFHEHSMFRVLEGTVEVREQEP